MSLIKDFQNKLDEIINDVKVVLGLVANISEAAMAAKRGDLDTSKALDVIIEKSEQVKVIADKFNIWW